MDSGEARKGREKEREHVHKASSCKEKHLLIFFKYVVPRKSPIFCYLLSIVFYVFFLKKGLLKKKIFRTLRAFAGGVRQGCMYG